MSEQSRPAGRRGPSIPSHRSPSTTGNGRPAPRNGVPRSPSSNGNGHNGKHPSPVAPAIPPVTTRLSPDEIEWFRRQLLAKRAELIGDVNHMEDEALRKNRSDASGDLSMMPIHMADIGTDNYEQEFTIGLISNEQEVLKEIDAALQRIQRGTFGVCEGNHKPIAKARLRIKPWARYSLQYKQMMEQDGRK